MKEAQFTCIVCPKSCAVTVTDRDGELSISGYECKRGMDHARDEYLHPNMEGFDWYFANLTGAVHQALKIE